MASIEVLAPPHESAMNLRGHGDPERPTAVDRLVEAAVHVVGVYGTFHPFGSLGPAFPGGVQQAQEVLVACVQLV